MIAMEVGNTRIKFGRFLDTHPNPGSEIPVCTAFLAVPLDSAELPWDEIQSLIQGDTSPLDELKCVAASVNPQGLSRLLADWPRHRWPQPRLLVSAELPIANLTRYPEKVGTDRLLKAVAANVLRTSGSPMIVVDSGTATTVDWITADGEFAGGAIFPGLALSAKSLHNHTAQLPLLDFRQMDHAPAVVGRETVAALESGVFWAHVGAVKELIQRMSHEQASTEQPPPVLITGGGGELLTQYIDQATYRPTLTLEGLVVASRSLMPKV
jgi:type III pantothenate kinase